MPENSGGIDDFGARQKLPTAARIECPMRVRTYEREAAVASIIHAGGVRGVGMGCGSDSIIHAAGVWSLT